LLFPNTIVINGDGEVVFLNAIVANDGGDKHIFIIFNSYPSFHELD
jgi:hypothetical protein